MNIFAYDWIADGWMIALREGGGLSQASVDVSRSNSEAYVAGLKSAVNLWKDDQQYSSIMLSRDDYSLLSEFEPEIKKSAPAKLNQLQEQPDNGGRASITLEGAMWLNSGWIFALRSNGGYHMAHVTADSNDATEYAQALLTGIKALANKEDTASIFLSHSDHNVASSNLTRAD